VFSNFHSVCRHTEPAQLESRLSETSSLFAQKRTANLKANIARASGSICKDEDPAQHGPETAQGVFTPPLATVMVCSSSTYMGVDAVLTTLSQEIKSMFGGHSGPAITERHARVCLRPAATLRMASWDTPHKDAQYLHRRGLLVQTDDYLLNVHLASDLLPLLGSHALQGFSPTDIKLLRPTASSSSSTSLSQLYERPTDAIPRIARARVDALTSMLSSDTTMPGWQRWIIESERTSLQKFLYELELVRMIPSVACTS
jgi:hypothetical protein